MVAAVDENDDMKRNDSSEAQLPDEEDRRSQINTCTY